MIEEEREPYKLFDCFLENHKDWDNFYKEISSFLKIDALANLRVYKNQAKSEIFQTYNLDKKFLSNFENKFKNNIDLINYLKEIKEMEVLDEEYLTNILNSNFVKSFKLFLKESNFPYILLSSILNNLNENVIFLIFRKNNGFSKKEKKTFKKLLNFLKTAFCFCSKLEKLENYIDILKKTVESEGKGIIVLDNSSNVILMNKIAEIILSRKDGLEITKNGLEVTDPVLSIQFKKNLRNMLSPEKFFKEEFLLAIPKKDKHIPLIIQMVPFKEKSSFSENLNKIIIVLYDPEFSPLPNSSFLERAFQFTDQERNIAILLAKGMDLKEVAENLKISLHTVRTHLKHIYSKTNTSRQAELVKLLLVIPQSF